MRTASQTLFAHVVGGPDETMELDVAALLLGDWERERTDIAHYTGLLDRWAQLVVERMVAHQGDQSDPDDPGNQISALNHVLFTELGFRGNETDYYDRRNNFLADVIDRRTGMPIALSVVYVEVARRIGVTVHGVGFPGHFLVRHDGGESVHIIDPFRQGKTVTRDELKEILRMAVGDRVQLTDALLQPTGHRQILSRMLMNLIGTYGREGDVAGCIEALERMRILEPDKPGLGDELDRLYRQLQTAN